MSFSLAQILLFIIVYLTGLFGVAYLADRGIITERITRHPAIYVLSLGVFAGAMASNGVIDLAHRYGYNFLLYYIGVVADVCHGHGIAAATAAPVPGSTSYLLWRTY